MSFPNDSKFSASIAWALKQATESMYSLDSIATDQQGSVGLCPFIKKRSEQSLFDPTDKPETGRYRSVEGSGKAVQE